MPFPKKPTSPPPKSRLTERSATLNSAEPRFKPFRKRLRTRRPKRKQRTNSRNSGNRAIPKGWQSFSPGLARRAPTLGVDRLNYQPCKLQGLNREHSFVAVAPPTQLSASSSSSWANICFRSSPEPGRQARTSARCSLTQLLVADRILGGPFRP